jgi:hypothetical protein
MPITFEEVTQTVINIVRENETFRKALQEAEAKIKLLEAQLAKKVE